MTLFFYNLGLVAALIAGAPWWLWKMATTHKYRHGLLQRLGKVPDRLRAASHTGPVLWLHAVSVGEVLAVSRLVGELDRAFPECRVLVSTTTRTGQDLARQRFGAERVFYCPLDLPWAVRAYLNAIRPRLLILAETEFWPNFLSGCFRRDIPVAVVNARISDRSWPRYLRLRRLWRPFLSRIARVLAQTETDAERLRALGCDPARVTVAGNLKFDVRAAQQAEATRLLRAQQANLRFIVAGSTLEGEEAALLEAWPRLLAAGPALVLVIAPRHPERFAAVAFLIRNSGFAWSRRSALAAGRQSPLSAARPAAEPEGPPLSAERGNSAAGHVSPVTGHGNSATGHMNSPAGQVSSVTGHDFSRAEAAPLEAGALAPEQIRPAQIILLDTIGELASVYSLASVAFVGGSLIPAGGHNPLEPAQFAVPIVMGPNYANFRAITDDLLAHQALRIAAKENLASTLIELLHDRPAAEAMGARARQVFDQQAGATDRSVNALRALLAAKAVPEHIA